MNVREILNLRETKGEVGIEIEVEGTDILMPDNKYWRGELDGSLRGESLEYVLEKPIPRDQVKAVLGVLSDEWLKNRTDIRESNRAGVHVHLNMQEESLSTLATFICLYYSFETLLLRFCGKEREGNLFCLRVQDAEQVIDLLLSALRTKRLRSLNTNQLRYSSLNLKALIQYGSLEFRGMRSTKNLYHIELWVRLLLCLKDAAKRYGKPSEVPYQLSLLGAEGFIHEVFGELSGSLLDNKDYEQVVFEDTRRVQEISYSLEWEAYEKAVTESRQEEGEVQREPRPIGRKRPAPPPEFAM